VKLPEVILSELPLSELPLSDVALSDVALSDVALSDVALSEAELPEAELSDVTDAPETVGRVAAKVVDDVLAGSGDRDRPEEPAEAADRDADRVRETAGDDLGRTVESVAEPVGAVTDAVGGLLGGDWPHRVVLGDIPPAAGSRRV
jgi:hypothetical protein